MKLSPTVSANNVCRLGFRVWATSILQKRSWNWGQLKRKHFLRIAGRLTGSIKQNLLSKS